MHYFAAHLDYETSERCGAGGMFQVISLTTDDDKDRTDLVDQSVHFPDLDALAGFLAKKLGVNPSDIDLNEV